MRHLICASIFALLFSTAAAAQEVVLPRRSCKECKITSTYDRFKNKTELTLFPMTVFEGAGGILSLGVQAEYDGHIQKGYRQAFVIVLVSVTKSYAPAGDTELYALLDGQPSSLGKLLPVKRFTEGPLFVASYAHLIDRPTLYKLAMARDPELRFDKVEFKLSSEQRIAIFDFLAAADGDPIRR